MTFIDVGSSLQLQWITVSTLIIAHCHCFVLSLTQNCKNLGPNYPGVTVQVRTKKCMDIIGI